MRDQVIRDAVNRHREADMPDTLPAARAGPEEPSLARGLARALWDSLWDPEQYSVLWAEWRRGLKDLQAIVLGPWGGSHEPLGTIGNPTPQVVTNEMGFFSRDRPEAAPPGLLEPTPAGPDFEQEMRSHAARIAEEPDQGLSIER